MGDELSIGRALGERATRLLDCSFHLKFRRG